MMKHILSLCLVLGAMSACADRAIPNVMPYRVPAEKRVRLIMSMDTANETDDALAIVHALLTPQFDMKAIVSGHFKDKVRAPQSMELSHTETLKVLDTTGFAGKVPALKGAEGPLADEQTPRMSEGAQFIIEEAKKDDPRPLYVMCGGTLTDIASAILTEPSITNRLTVTWSGGGRYSSGNASEYNLSGDWKAVNVVFSSCVPVWQFPQDIYSKVRVTSAELAANLWCYGAFGRYQFDAMMAYNDKHRRQRGWPRGEDWTDGDAPAISAMMDPGAHVDTFEMRPAPRITPNLRYDFNTVNRPIRVYTQLDGRIIIADLFAKIKLAYGR